MKKRRLLLFGSLSVATIIILGVLVMSPPSPCVTKANFDRVQEGMTLSEVMEILGNDPVIVPTVQIFSGTAESYERFKQSRGVIKTYSWRGRDGAYAEIRFRNGVVKTKIEWMDPTETMWQKVRRVLHLP